VEDNTIKPACLIYLDRFVSAILTPVAPDYPVFWWATDSARTAPFGDKVRLSVDRTPPRRSDGTSTTGTIQIYFVELASLRRAYSERVCEFLPRAMQHTSRKTSVAAGPLVELRFFED